VPSGEQLNLYMIIKSREDHYKVIVIEKYLKVA
jgi:hypothetical protein